MPCVLCIGWLGHRGDPSRLAKASNRCERQGPQPGWYDSTNRALSLQEDYSRKSQGGLTRLRAHHRTEEV